MQVERIEIAPRFKIDTSKHVYNFHDLFHIRRRKEKKFPEMKIWMVKTVRKYFFVVLHYNDLVVGFQLLTRACEKKILRFLINMP